MILSYAGEPAGRPLLFTSGGPPDEGPATSGKPRETAPLGKRRVLIVEDEALVAMNIESALVAAGFEVLQIVDTATDAVEAARRLNPDLVLMDIALRDGDGVSAARTIKLRHNTQIVFLSGNSDPKTIAEAHAIEGATFILKPFLTDRLAKLVLAALSA